MSGRFMAPLLLWPVRVLGPAVEMERKKERKPMTNPFSKQLRKEPDTFTWASERVDVHQGSGSFHMSATVQLALQGSREEPSFQPDTLKGLHSSHAIQNCVDDTMMLQ